MIITATTHALPSEITVEQSGVNPNDLTIRYDMDGDFRMYMPKTEAIAFAKQLLAVADPKATEALAYLVTLSDRICRAHETGNNGAIMGEATLCPSFATALRATLDDILLAKVQA